MLKTDNNKKKKKTEHDLREILFQSESLTLFTLLFYLSIVNTVERDVAMLIKGGTDLCLQTLVILCIGHCWEGLLRRDSNPILYNPPRSPRQIIASEDTMGDRTLCLILLSYLAGSSYGQTQWVLWSLHSLISFYCFFILIFSKIVFIFWLVLHFWKDFSPQKYVWLALFSFLGVYLHQMCLNALANACQRIRYIW